jgi:SAM-dependent methyltransferase
MTERLDNEISRGFDDFWSRFPARPSLADQRILEIGCGRGALCIDMGLHGARQVLGIDIREADINAAQEFVSAQYSQLNERVQFSARPLDEIASGTFDLIVSKDAFEHILDVQGVLVNCRRLLSESGRMYIGFSPLYHSPYGDHDRRRTAFRDWGSAGRILAALPWGHLLFERAIILRQARIQNRDIRSMHDLNLNKMSIRQFRERIAAAGFTAEYFAVNQGGHRVASLLELPRRLPWLENICTYNAYCILKPQAEQED